MRRIIFAVLVIWMIFTLAPVAAQQGVTYYVNVRAAKVRAEPKATAKLLTTLGRSKAVVVLEVVIGDKVGHVDTWYRVKVRGKDGYILNSLLTDRVPVVASSTAGNNSKPNNTTNNSTSSVTSATDTPVSVIPTSPPAPADTSCRGATKCSQMTSCAQAYACFNAGNHRLDGDKDGVPCETICPGG